MTNKKKIHNCPYLANKNKCTHKSPIKRISGKIRRCGYKYPENCNMYLEWEEIRTIDFIEEKAILDPLNNEIEVSDD